jgi:excisionase family DNA binding protein
MELRYVDSMHEVSPSHSSTGGGEAQPEEPLAYTVPHAARALDISARKAWELVHSGVIESIKIGRSRRVTRRALEAYVDSLRSAA